MRTERVELPGYREVALKTDSRVPATARDRQRFMREVPAAGQVSDHPNVVAVYDAGVVTSWDAGGPKPDPLETRSKRKDAHALAEQ